jgi:AcrR family transcriptional regulator
VDFRFRNYNGISVPVANDMTPNASAPPLASAPAAVERTQRADARRNRKRVIDAARRCMARKGLDAQMEEIARAAGVGVGTVYRHFPTKDDLVEALAMARFERLATLAREALATPDPWQSFEDFMHTSARIQGEDRALSEVLTSRPETMSRAAEAVDMLGLVAQLMKRGQAARVIRPDADPRDVPMLMCALAGTYRNRYANPERYIAIVLDGLRAAPRKPAKLPPVADA